MVLMKSSVTSPSKIGTAKNENNPLEKLKWGNINMQLNKYECFRSLFTIKNCGRT